MLRRITETPLPGPKCRHVGAGEIEIAKVENGASTRMRCETATVSMRPIASRLNLPHRLLARSLFCTNRRCRAAA